MCLLVIKVKFKYVFVNLTIFNQLFDFEKIIEYKICGESVPIYLVH